MLIQNTNIRRVTLVMGLLLLSACTRSVSNVDSQGKTLKPVFPDPTTAVRPEGSFVNVNNLRNVRPGMTKAELYELTGVPHFKEGAFGVKEWDYIFHFSKSDNTVLTCQYKVLFNSSMKAESFYFKPDNCLSQLSESNKILPAVAEVLSADGLFDFGSAKLSRQGQLQLQILSEKLAKENKEEQHVLITGYTDRIGDPARNKKLSHARAESAKAYLVQEGIPSSIIETRGMGEADPVIMCPGKKSAVVIQCLAKNRRVVINVTG
jgi:outer membrane protein OmpA-like peptidoglycan-associated protein